MAGKYWYTDEDGKRKRTPAGVDREYERYQSSKKAKRDRAARNRARREAIREGKVKKGDRSHEVDHIKGLGEGGSTKKSNTRVVSRTFNRSRKQNSRRRGSRRIKSSWGV